MSKNKRDSHRSVWKSLIAHEFSDAVDMDLVLAISGDKKATSAEKRKLSALKKTRGELFYCDLLFALTHRLFPPEHAKFLWKGIQKHKKWLTERINRPVLIAVAALDYLTSVEIEMEQPVLVSEHRFSRVVNVALTDGLTGLYDHVTLKASIADEIKRFTRYGNELCLIMIDIDHFKQYNDTNGHQIGDAILVELADILQSETRDVDVCARYGGDEFAILLPQTPVEEGLALAERVRRHVERRFLSRDKVTISAGVAACPHHAKEAKKLIRKADKALYRAKKDGKNRVQSA